MSTGDFGFMTDAALTRYFAAAVLERDRYERQGNTRALARKQAEVDGAHAEMARRGIATEYPVR